MIPGNPDRPRIRGPLPGTARRAAALLAALAVLSCDVKRAEERRDVTVPLQITAVSPERGATTGGDVVTVWFASSGTAGAAGVQVDFGGVPCLVTAVIGPAESLLWGVTVVTPALSRGNHEVDLRLPTGERACRAGGWFAYPASPALGAQAAITGSSGPTRLAAGDFDGDGAPELAVAQSAPAVQARIVLFRTDPTSSWGVWREVSSPGPVLLLTPAALDGDDATDLCVLSWNGIGAAALRVYRSRVGFDSAAQDLTLTAGASDVCVCALDAGPGQDLAVAAGSLPQLMIFRNSGTGFLGLSETKSLSCTSGGVACGQFDTDGAPDLVAGQGALDQMALLSGIGGGWIGEASPAGMAQSPASVEAADLDADGDDDILFASQGLPLIGTLLNDGNGNFGTMNTMPLPSVASCIRILDFDQDGIPDLLGVSGADLYIMSGNGTGGVDPSKELHIQIGSMIGGVELVDADLDGFPDIFLSEPGANLVWLFLNTSS